MKSIYFSLTALTLTFGVFFASAREAPPPEAAAAAAEAQTEITTSFICRDVDVAVDEGYGVSSHETRRECAPKD